VQILRKLRQQKINSFTVKSLVKSTSHWILASCYHLEILTSKVLIVF
jgi:hypothetical protein